MSCILPPVVTALVNAANLMSQMSAPVPRSIISATWPPPLSLQAHPSPVIKISKTHKCVIYHAAAVLSSLAHTHDIPQCHLDARHAATVIDRSSMFNALTLHRELARFPLALPELLYLGFPPPFSDSRTDRLEFRRSCADALQIILPRPYDCEIP